MEQNTLVFQINDVKNSWCSAKIRVGPFGNSEIEWPEKFPWAMWTDRTQMWVTLPQGATRQLLLRKEPIVQFSTTLDCLQIDYNPMDPDGAPDGE
jgi:hypothetical protein